MNPSTATRLTSLVGIATAISGVDILPPYDPPSFVQTDADRERIARAEAKRVRRGRR